jgi:hypothetical protein
VAKDLRSSVQACCTTAWLPPDTTIWLSSPSFAGIAFQLTSISVGFTMKRK